jgi:translocation and assembly module TamB
VLSDDIHVQAFGLDTHVAGQLRFILSGAREPRAQGELRLVGGVFEAYGQRLEIEQGSMIFTGPLDNPLINVRAIRRIDGVDGTVIAGIHLTGPARSLSSSVYAEPAMSEANALSYLVLGRPLEDATAADGSNLSNTAYALGLRQAATITNQIGQTVGLDELRVSGNNQNTTELVAGKQVNSRLYARYAYGVFTRLGHLLLQYRLSDSFTIEIGAGQTQSMDIMYTIERE